MALPKKRGSFMLMVLPQARRPIWSVLSQGTERETSIRAGRDACPIKIIHFRAGYRHPGPVLYIMQAAIG
jgi:hypothetical protein